MWSPEDPNLQGVPFPEDVHAPCVVNHVSEASTETCEEQKYKEQSGSHFLHSLPLETKPS